MRFGVNRKKELQLEDRRKRSCVGAISTKVGHKTQSNS